MRAPRIIERPWIGLLLAIGVAAWTQAAALRDPFFADDYLFLDQVEGRSFFAALTAPDPIGNFLRPIGRQAHFWVWSRAFGGSALVFHAVNYLLFIIAVAALWHLVRRMASSSAAHVAAMLLALHYAVDVPVRWASGSQDLLALNAALAALLLVTGGRPFPAAVAFFLGLLCKETIALTPLVAVAILRARQPNWRGTWRTAAPLFAAFAAWALLLLAAVATGRIHPTTDPSFGPAAIAAALLHLPQVALGLEWPANGLGAGALASLAMAFVAAAAVAWLVRRESASGPARPEDRSAWRAGVVWALAGAIPVAAVASIWSAYFYLFAWCGIAALAGVMAARRPALAGALVLVAGAGSELARGADGFSVRRDPWALRSHVNGAYLDRSNERVGRFAEQLRRMHPRLAPRTTVVFAGIPGSIGWQAGDGALLRRVYRDPTLRSFYLSALPPEALAEGPVLFFVAAGEELREVTDAPGRLHLALSLVHGEMPLTARAMLELEARRRPHDPLVREWLGWVRLESGAPARAWRGADGVVRGGALAFDRAQAALASRDTAAATDWLDRACREVPLDARAHALRADLALIGGDAVRAEREAYAARVLAPGDAGAWRRWAAVLLLAERPEMALRALERYVALDGERAARDATVQNLLAVLRQGETDLAPSGAR